MKTDSLFVARDIVSTLKGIAPVYPLRPAVNARYPFIFYWRDNLTEEKTKDGRYCDTLTYVIVVAALTPEESLTKAAQVRSAMDDMESSDFILDTRLVSSFESFTDDGSSGAYVTTLTYEINIYK